MKEIALERGLPASAEAERTILGAILLDNQAYYEVANLSTDDFALDSHRRIFACMAALLSDGQAVDIITLSEDLERQKELQTIGNRAYLFSLTENLPRRLSIESYVAIVKEKSQLRRLMGLCRIARERAADQSEPYSSIRNELQEALLEIDTEEAKVYSAREIGQDAINVIFGREGEKQEVFSTGIPGVDEMTGGGIRKGEFWIWGGLPGRRKTTAARRMVRRNAGSGVPCLVFSSEASRADWIAKDAANDLEIPSWKMRKRGFLNLIDRQRIEEHIDQVINRLPIYFDDRSSITLQSFLAVSKLAIFRHKVELIVHDYIQLMDGPGKELRMVLGNIGKRMTQFAKTENVAIVALSQLTSDAKNVNRRPTMFDLNEAKSLAAHAHVVLLNFTPLDDRGKFTGKDETIVGKQRSGPTGPVPVEYLQDSGTFLDRVEDGE